MQSHKTSISGLSFYEFLNQLHLPMLSRNTVHYTHTHQQRLKMQDAGINIHLTEPKVQLKISSNYIYGKICCTTIISIQRKKHISHPEQCLPLEHVYIYSDIFGARHNLGKEDTKCAYGNCTLYHVAPHTLGHQHPCMASMRNSSSGEDVLE